MTSTNTKSAYLKELGLSDIEAKVYLALLDRSPISVRDLAQIIGIKRTTAYFYIDELIKKGLISRTGNETKRVISAIPPEKSFSSLTQQRMQKAKNIHAQFPHILTIIENNILSSQSITDSEIRYYKGKIGIKQIYDEALKSDELHVYASFSEIMPVIPEDTHLFDNAMKRNKKMKIYEIYTDTTDEIIKYPYTVQNLRYQYKFMPLETRLFSTVHLIFANKVAIIDVRNAIVGIVLNSAEYYRISLGLFNYIWNLLPAPSI